MFAQPVGLATSAYALSMRHAVKASARPQPVDADHRRGQVVPFFRVSFGSNTIQEANIPVVDLKDFLSRDAAKKEAFVKTFGNGLRDVGFVALKGHGISPQLFDRHYTAMAEMFGLPPTTLQKFAFVRSHQVERGYQPPGELKPVKKDGQTVMGTDGKPLMKGDPKQNWSTGIAYNVYPRQARSMALSNQEIFKQMQQVGLKLVDALAVYLEDDKGYLRQMVRDKHGKPNSPHLMRSIHYPKATPEGLAEMEKTGEPEMRAGEHQDLSFFTMLPQATQSGLQLKQKDGSWLTIHAQQGMIIVNSGDLLKFLTQNLTSKSGESRSIVSTPHRVIGDKETALKDRYSNPFFFHLNFKGPIRDLRTGEPIRVVIPEKDIDVTLDEGLRYLHARLVRSNTLPPGTTYESYRKQYFNVGRSLPKAVRESGADGLIAKSIHRPGDLKKP